jgi:hypothetical protein
VLLFGGDGLGVAGGGDLAAVPSSFRRAMRLQLVVDIATPIHRASLKKRQCK